MGHTVTLTDLRTQLYEITDDENAATRVPVTLANRLLNKGYRRWFDIMADTSPFFQGKPAAFLTVAGTGDYSAATDIYRLYKMRVAETFTTVPTLQPGPNGYTIEPFLLDEIMDRRSPAGWTRSSPPRYIFGSGDVGGFLFSPVPNAVYCVTYLYLQTPADLSDGPPVVSFNDINFGALYIVHFAARELAFRQRDDELINYHTMLMKEYEECCRREIANHDLLPERALDLKSRYPGSRRRRWGWPFGR